MAKIKKEFEYWADTAATYDAGTAYVVGEEAQRETKAWLLNQLQETDHVLELGCGTGQFSEVIAGKARHLTAADGALRMLDMTRLRLSPFGNTIVQMQDCYHTSFADSLFDALFLGNVIHILREPVKALTEGGRVLKPGGRILLADATSFGMPFWSKLAMGMRYLRRFGMPPKENRVVSPHDVANLLETAGFLVEESRLIEKETHVVCVKGRKQL